MVLCRSATTTLHLSQCPLSASRCMRLSDGLPCLSHPRPLPLAARRALSRRARHTGRPKNASGREKAPRAGQPVMSSCIGTAGSCARITAPLRAPPLAALASARPRPHLLASSLSHSHCHSLALSPSPARLTALPMAAMAAMAAMAVPRHDGCTLSILTTPLADPASKLSLGGPHPRPFLLARPGSRRGCNLCRRVHAYTNTTYTCLL